jgi:hypothetical protein
MLAELTEFDLNSSRTCLNVGRPTKQNPFEATRLGFANFCEESSGAAYAKNGARPKSVFIPAWRRGNGAAYPGI